MHYGVHNKRHGLDMDMLTEKNRFIAILDLKPTAIGCATFSIDFL